MTCSASITLKKEDTDGRIPQQTLDHYVRTELARQLGNSLKPALPIERSDQAPAADPSAAGVDFTTELIVLTPRQWQALKAALSHPLMALPPEQQRLLEQLLTAIEGPASCPLANPP